jgi:hypothetical protein
LRGSACHPWRGRHRRWLPWLTHARTRNPSAGPPLPASPALLRCCGRRTLPPDLACCQRPLRLKASLLCAVCCHPFAVFQGICVLFGPCFLAVVGACGTDAAPYPDCWTGRMVAVEEVRQGQWPPADPIMGWHQSVCDLNNTAISGCSAHHRCSCSYRLYGKFQRPRWAHLPAVIRCRLRPF